MRQCFYAIFSDNGRKVFRPKSGAAKTVVARFRRQTYNERRHLFGNRLHCFGRSRSCEIWLHRQCLASNNTNEREMKRNICCIQMGAFFTFHLVYGGSIGSSKVIWHENIDGMRAQRRACGRRMHLCEIAKRKTKHIQHHQRGSVRLHRQQWHMISIAPKWEMANGEWIRDMGPIHQKCVRKWRKYEFYLCIHFLIIYIHKINFIGAVMHARISPQM